MFAQGAGRQRRRTGLDRLSRWQADCLGLAGSARRLRETGALIGNEGRRRQTGVVGRLFLHRERGAWRTSRRGDVEGRHRLCAVARCAAHRSLSGRQAGTRARRFDVVRCEKHVRPRGFCRSRATQANATRRAQDAPTSERIQKSQQLIFPRVGQRVVSGSDARGLTGTARDGFLRRECQAVVHQAVTRP